MKLFPLSRGCDDANYSFTTTRSKASSILLQKNMTKSGCQTERGKIHNILYLDSPKLAGCAFANFGNSSGTEEEPSQKREKNGRKKKKIKDASNGNRTRVLSITDQMSVLTNQVQLKIQFRHIFDQNCSFTDSLHRLSSRFARTSSVPLEINESFLTS